MLGVSGLFTPYAATDRRQAAKAEGVSNRTKQCHDGGKIDIADQNHVVARAAIQQQGAGARDEKVISATTINLIIAGDAIQGIMARVA
jgi:hypothetical protein